MLISAEELSNVYGVSPNGVLHVGAHLAEEESAYLKFDWDGTSKIYWVEANPEIASHLCSIVNQERSLVFQALAWNESNLEKIFYVNNYTQASSVFELGEVTNKYDGLDKFKQLRLLTIRLDEMLPKECNFDFVNLDIQGSELQALQGLGETLKQVKWIYTEVNRLPLYKNMPLIDELDSFLFDKGFKRKITRWQFNAGWGDALYIKTDSRNPSIYKKMHGVLNFYNLAHFRKSFLIALKFVIKYFIKQSRT